MAILQVLRSGLVGQATAGEEGGQATTQDQSRRCPVLYHLFLDLVGPIPPSLSNAILHSTLKILI